MQVGRCCQDEDDNLALAISVWHDSNKIAYSNCYVIFVDNLAKEEYQVVNLDVPSPTQQIQLFPSSTTVVGTGCAPFTGGRQ